MWGESPWLNLLSEEELDLEVLLFDRGKHRVVDCIKHLGGVGTDIVQEELDRVQGFRRRARGELLSCEFRCESHL